MSDYQCPTCLSVGFKRSVLPGRCEFCDGVANGECVDDIAVDHFAELMKAKLKQAREEKGRGGWNDYNACGVTHLVQMFNSHISKSNPGNWIDLANLAMMIHIREEMGNRP